MVAVARVEERVEEVKEVVRSSCPRHGGWVTMAMEGSAGTYYCVHNYDVPAAVPVPVTVRMYMSRTKKFDMTYDHDL